MYGFQVKELWQSPDIADLPNVRIASTRSLSHLPSWLFLKVKRALSGLRGATLTRSANLTWLQRPFHPAWPTWESILKRPLVFDVDDAVWLKKPFGELVARSIAKRSTAILAGNSHIANWFSPFCKKVSIIPTAIDTNRFKVRGPSEGRSGNTFTIGWTGLARNFEYLYSIEHALARFLYDYPHSRLLILAERAPTFTAIPPHRVIFRQWSPANEAEVLHNMDVGIMPLLNDPWCLGKCSFKMLQYMASGLPVVVSPVGMNSDILRYGKLGMGATTDSEWYDSFKFFMDNPADALSFGSTGRQVVEDHYSSSRVAPMIAKVFLDAVG